MADYKRLGASEPAATTNVALYTVASGNQTVVSTIAVCNKGASTAAIRLAHMVNANGTVTSPADADFFEYDTPILPSSVAGTVYLTVGATMGDLDSIMCYSSNGDVSFTAWGVENP